MPPKKRKSYSIEFKITALLELAENKNNITKTAKAIGVHRKQVRKFNMVRKKIMEIESEIFHKLF